MAGGAILQAVPRQSVCQCRSAVAPCQGNRPPKSPANPAHSNPIGQPRAGGCTQQLCVWLRPIRGAGGARRAGARSIVRPLAGARDDGPRQGASKPHGVWRSGQIRRAALRACRVRPGLRCRRRRWRGRAGAAPPRPAIVQTDRPGARSGRLSGQGTGARAATAASTTASSATSARRTRRASSASRPASDPSRSSIGIAARSRTRVKRGSRLLGSSA